jgi:hypothetical protein
MPSVAELPRRRRWGAAAAVAILVLVLAAVLPATRTTVIVLPAAPLAEPTAIILLDYGATSSLILPAGPGRAVAYAYGDWEYYALRRKGWWNLVRALVWPTDGGLARLPLDASIEPEAIRRELPYAVEALHVLRADRSAVDRLRERLDELYRRGVDVRQVTWPEGITFVPHPDRYTYFYNSNHAVADWLKDLGCGVRGPAVYARWRVENAALNQ